MTKDELILYLRRHAGAYSVPGVDNHNLAKWLEAAPAARKPYPSYAEAEATRIKQVAPAEPVAWAISYDGKTPYALWDYGDGALLDLEIKRLGGTASKMPLYAAHAAPAPDPDRLPMPQNDDQAAAMVSLGMAWLEQHAPDRLATPAEPAPASVAPKFGQAVELAQALGYLWTCMGWIKGAPSLEAEPAPAGKPVACIQHFNGDKGRLFFLDDVDPPPGSDSYIDAVTWTMLYAAPAAPAPDRTGMTYYKNIDCKAVNADAADCICWTPAPAASAEPNCRVMWVDTVGAYHHTIEACKGPVAYVEVDGRVYYPLTDAAHQSLVAAACGHGKFPPLAAPAAPAQAEVEAKPATRSQRLADAGYTARDRRIECDECGTKVSTQMLPVHKCEPAQQDTCLILWKAMNAAQKYGQRTDDKLIVEFLREAGYVIAPAASAPVPLTDEQKGDRWRELLTHADKFTPADWFEAGVDFAERAHGIGIAAPAPDTRTPDQIPTIESSLVHAQSIIKEAMQSSGDDIGPSLFEQMQIFLELSDEALSAAASPAAPAQDECGNTPYDEGPFTIAAPAPAIAVSKGEQA
jgi:hypothetical protein